MNDRDYFKKIQSKIYNPDTNPIELERYEKQLLLKIKFEPENTNTIEILLGKLYFEKKDYTNSTKQFLSAVQKNPDIVSSYLGLYKNYIMIEDFDNAYKAIIAYKEKNNKKVECAIILSMLERILNGSTNIREITKNEYMMENLKNKELIDKYSEFIDCYNKQEYSKGLILLTTCDAIAKKHHLFLEFETLKSLLNALKCKEDKMLTDNLYEKLQQAITDENYEEAVVIIKLLLRKQIKNEKLVYNALYILIKNGYYEELEDYIDKIIFKKDQKDIKKLLKNAIVNQRNFDALSTEQQNVYNKAIEYGHEYYSKGDIFTAYDIYNWGYYITKQPIFIYYIGKMLFKNGNYKGARKCFEEYITVGSDKLAKAFLYLANLDNLLKPRKSIKYSDRLNKLDIMVYNSNFVSEFYDRNDEEVDAVKFAVQKRLAKDINEEFFLRRKA